MILYKISFSRKFCLGIWDVYNSTGNLTSAFITAAASREQTY